MGERMLFLSDPYKGHDEKGHISMLKDTIQNEDIIVMNICAPNNTATTTIRYKLQEIQRDIDKTP